MKMGMLKKNLSMLLCAAMVCTGSMSVLAANVSEEAVANVSEEAVADASEEAIADVSEEVIGDAAAESEEMVGEVEPLQPKEYVVLLDETDKKFYIRFLDSENGLSDGTYNVYVETYGYKGTYTPVTIIDSCNLVVENGVGTISYEGEMIDLISAAYGEDVTQGVKETEHKSDSYVMQLWGVEGDVSMELVHYGVSYNQYDDKVNYNSGGSSRHRCGDELLQLNYVESNYPQLYASDWNDVKPDNYTITMHSFTDGRVLATATAPASELLDLSKKWTLPDEFQQKVESSRTLVYFLAEGKTGSVAAGYFIKRGSSGPSVKTPRFENSTVNIFNGKATKLKLLDTKIDNKTTLKARNWFSDNPEIATINKKTGKITPKKTGTVTITVDLVKGSDVYKSLSCTVNVEKATVSSNKATLTMGADEPQSLTLKLDNLFPGQQKEEWTALKKTVATVDAEGVVTPLKAGKAKFKTKRDGKTFVVTVTVYNPEIVTPRRNRIDGSDELKLVKNKTLKLKVKGGYKPKYTSLNPEFASVTGAGKVKGLAAGVAVIKIETVDKTLYQVINVEEPSAGK